MPESNKPMRCLGCETIITKAFVNPAVVPQSNPRRWLVFCRECASSLMTRHKWEEIVRKGDDLRKDYAPTIIVPDWLRTR